MNVCVLRALPRRSRGGMATEHETAAIWGRGWCTSGRAGTDGGMYACTQLCQFFAVVITARSPVEDGAAHPPGRSERVARARSASPSTASREVNAHTHAQARSPADHRHVGGSAVHRRVGRSGCCRPRGVLTFDCGRFQRLHGNHQWRDGIVLERLVQQLEPRRAGWHHLDAGHAHWRRRRGLCKQCHQRARWSGRRRGTDRRNDPRGQSGCRFRALCPPRLWWWRWEHRLHVGHSRRRGRGGGRLGHGNDVADRQRGCGGNGPK